MSVRVRTKAKWCAKGNSKETYVSIGTVETRFPAERRGSAMSVHGSFTRQKRSDMKNAQHELHRWLNPTHREDGTKG